VSFLRGCCYADDSQAHIQDCGAWESISWRFGESGLAKFRPKQRQEGMDLEKTAAIALERVKGVSELYNRLLLIAGPVASGKTMLLRRMAVLSGYPLLNVGTELSKQMLELTERQRIIELPKQLYLLAESAAALIGASCFGMRRTVP
jgi:hypothetical protein